MMYMYILLDNTIIFTDHDTVDISIYVSFVYMDIYTGQHNNLSKMLLTSLNYVLLQLNR